MPAGFARITCSRPWRWRRTRQASSRTRKCLEIAGSEIRNGLASSVTRVPPCPARRSKIRRRVGCARAAKTVVTPLCLLTNVRNIYDKASLQVKKIFNMDVKYYERRYSFDECPFARLALCSIVRADSGRTTSHSELSARKLRNFRIADED